jgi:hypothetical protein
MERYCALNYIYTNLAFHPNITKNVRNFETKEVIPSSDNDTKLAEDGNIIENVTALCVIVLLSALITETITVLSFGAITVGSSNGAHIRSDNGSNVPSAIAIRSGIFSTMMKSHEITQKYKHSVIAMII